MITQLLFHWSIQDVLSTSSLWDFCIALFLSCGATCKCHFQSSLGTAVRASTHCLLLLPATNTFVITWSLHAGFNQRAAGRKTVLDRSTGADCWNGVLVSERLIGHFRWIPIRSDFRFLANIAPISDLYIGSTHLYSSHSMDEIYGGSFPTRAL